MMITTKPVLHNSALTHHRRVEATTPFTNVPTLSLAMEHAHKKKKKKGKKTEWSTSFQVVTVLTTFTIPSCLPACLKNLR